MVEDVSRPDVNGNKPKMQAIADIYKGMLESLNLGHMNVGCNDNIMSSVTVRGSYDKKEDWSNGIFENSRYFIFTIVPMDGKRYYDDKDDKACVQLLSCGHKLNVKKFRKYTASVVKIVAKMEEWLKANVSDHTA